MVVLGLGLALTVPPLTNTAVSAVPDSQAGVASGVNDEAARVAALLGVAVTGLVFATVFRMSLREALTPLSIPRARSINAYRGALGAGVLIALAGALVAFVAIQNRPPLISGPVGSPQAVQLNRRRRLGLRGLAARQRYAETKMTIRPGLAAPGFCLADLRGERRCVEDLRGRPAILVFLRYLG